MRGISLKKISLALSLLLAFVFLTAAPISLAAEKKVIVYTATRADISGPIFEAFTDETGITVEYEYSRKRK